MASDFAKGSSLKNAPANPTKIALAKMLAPKTISTTDPASLWAKNHRQRADTKAEGRGFRSLTIWMSLIGLI